jgi:hypothetical protein
MTRIIGGVRIDTINDIVPDIDKDGRQGFRMYAADGSLLVVEEGALIIRAHVLDEVLVELKKMNFYLSLMTDVDLES